MAMRFIYNEEIKIPYSLIDKDHANNWTVIKFLLRSDVRDWMKTYEIKSEVRSTKYEGFKLYFTNPEDAFAFKIRWL